jgi:ubiquinone biosynthesis protein
MLQKTLLNIEGLGRELYPELDVLAASKPELERILQEKHGIDQAASDLRERLPGWLSQAPDMPGLLHDYLKLATEGKLISKADPRDLALSRSDEQKSNRRILRAISGSSLFLSGAILTGLEAGPWFLFEMSVPGLVSMALGAWVMIRANSQFRHPG